MMAYPEEPMMGRTAYCALCKITVGHFKKFEQLGSREAAHYALLKHLSEVHPEPTKTHFEYHRPTLRELLRKLSDV